MENKSSGTTDTAKRKKAFKWLKIFLIFIIVIAVVLALLPFGIKYGIKNTLLKNGADQAYIEDIDFNPFSGRLIVHNLRIRKEDTTPFQISRLITEISWASLFRKRIYLEELTVNNLDLSVRQLSDSEWSVGGIAPPSESKEPDQKPSEWGFGAGHIEITASTVTIKGQRIDAELNIDHLKFNNTKSWEPDLAANLDFSGHLNKGTFSVKTELRPFSDTPGIRGTVSVQNLSLASFIEALPPELKALEGVLDVTSKIALVKDAASVVHVTHKGAITLKKAVGVTDAVSLQSDSIDWEGSFDYTMKDDAHDFVIEGNVDIANILISSPDQKILLMASDSISLNNIRAEGKDSISISKITSENMEIVKHSPDKLTPPDISVPLFRTGVITVSELAVKGLNEVSIKSVDLKGARALARRKADGNWHLIEEVLKDSKDGQPEKDSDMEPGEKLKIQISDIHIRNESSLQFEDEGVEPPYRTELYVNNASIKNLDTSNPENKIPLILEGKIGEYSTISITGDMKPFGNQLSMMIKGKLNEIDLHSLSSYTKKHLGYTVVSGHLDGEIAYKITSGEIDGTNSLIIKKLKLSPTDEDIIKKMAAELSISPESALSLLRDRDGTIRLNVPVSGNISDPKIGMGDIINKALSGALKKAAFSYLKHAVQPYGTLITVIQIAGKAARIRLDPVGFEPGESALDEKAGEYLTVTAKLMKERPDIQLSICGKASLSDITVLTEKASEALPAKTELEQSAKEAEDKEKNEVPEVALSDEQILTFAKDRALNIKRYLSEELGVTSDRLFICNPEIDRDEKSKPEVELLI